ncbi:hypothetical protein A8950_0125 [Dongia mobilis]|uniref:Polysaccharide deacetylase n=1 Tax=Dongia mobilis TaxID=578943 RepID=A0A4R6WWG1_9PROT|nr:hypothetical protein [Dongia mobilis]TDQ86433.1 hypothetical protein A8950_0125 [Dongia mobilis]
MVPEITSADRADWDDLARECDRWAEAGAQPTLWWRDDDAVADSPALRQLMAVAQVPVALAVIPLAPERPLQPSLDEALAAWPAASVLQHGIAHRNRAAASAKKSEFPPADPSDPSAARMAAEIAAGLTAGRAALERAFGPRFLPVLTPPWNRLAPVWAGSLPGLGFRGLSRFGEPPYAARPAIAGLREIDTHVDVIDWRGGGGFLGEAACLGRLAGHLAARRAGAARRDQPTGLLTHHLVHDAATWRFLENLQDWLARRGNPASFQDARDLWPSRRQGNGSGMSSRQHD